jgi:ribosomal protein S18 acetylase RimI-like enzyme
MSVQISPERPDSPDASALVLELEAHLEPLYPSASRHGFSIERLLSQGVEFFVLRSDGRPAACGGVLFVEQDGESYGEVKRMWVRPEQRGNGFAKRMLEHLEAHARARGVPVMRLETGIHQREAIGLYERMGYRRIPPFGPYSDDPLSRCYEKRLAQDRSGDPMTDEFGSPTSS